MIKRSKSVIESLFEPNERLRDPESLESEQPGFAQNTYRAEKPEIFVAWGICTHLGCSVSYNAPGTNKMLGPHFEKGLFFCPCHGSAYDLSGRVFKNMPAPKNLEIPEYEFIDDSVIRVTYVKRF